MTVVALFAVAIGPMCLILGFDTRTLVKRGNIFGAIARDKFQFHRESSQNIFLVDWS